MGLLSKMVIFVPMPIQCLTSIRFSFDQAGESLPLDPQVAAFVEGIYQFELGELGTEVALFNDGLPALLILPKPDMASTCRVRNELIALDSIWFTAGSLNPSYWLPPQTAAAEKLTIVRFLPSAWQALFGKQAVVAPYVHNLADYHPRYYSMFQQVYQAPSLIEGLIDLLASLFSSCAMDEEVLAFDQLAIDFSAGHRMQGKNRSALSTFHPKWVQRQFKRNLGISPYQFGQLQRFLAAYKILGEDSALNLHAVADDCGYYDANHLIKDFNKYLGTSPRQYFKAQQAL
ncbi:helix-turn-helix domain-containing protein [Sphingobacterium paludis]|uniref:Helix-turn-helix protein n=1 Tax=Sphingobacterium paludis TaxID=1476465 RepID=A0A4R7D0B7_9SPHI|nr:helix-turn-helix domain-containing protein [Sphingobacterium paludis]TDS12186.1 helix-turn-helix protein [Sphingobacterium paludis]